MKRRNFIKSAAAAGAGLMILPGCVTKGKGANDKLNIARPDRGLWTWPGLLGSFKD